MSIKPNKIKYSSIEDGKSIRVDNFSIGTSPRNIYGPTSQTNYWAGITPQISGYTIYVNKASQGPSIYTPQNDDGLIWAANYFKANVTNITEAITWFDAQQDMMVSNFDYPDVVTNGLAFMVDSSFIGSYPRSGTTWKDISFSGNNVTLQNSPSFILSGNGYFDFSSNSSNYASFGDLGTLTNFSLECWVLFKSLPTSNTFPAIITNVFDSNNINFAIGVLTTPWDGKISGGFWVAGSGWQNTSGFTPSINQWYHIVTTYDGSIINQYVDGSLQSIKTTNLTPGTSNSGCYLMRRWDSPDYINGYLLNAKIYNRALSSTEVIQNYNAHGSPKDIFVDNLLLQLDAYSILSYPRTGTTWYSMVNSISNDGTIYNGVSFNGGNGGYLSFDGSNDYVSLPANFFNPDAGDPFSINIWFKTSTSGGVIFGQQNTSSPAIIPSAYVPAIYIDSNGKIVTSCFWGGNSNNVTTSSSSVTDGLWHNIVVTYASGVQTTYLDNVMIGQISKTQTNYAATYYYFIGAGYNVNWPVANGIYFNGGIGYASFYTSELTSAQVSNNYNTIKNRYL